MYKKIKEEIGSSYYQQNFSNDGQRFVAWYLRNVFLRDMNEAKDDITDGPNDKQIDAIYIDNEKSVVNIIQGKFINNDLIGAEPLREVLSSWAQIKDLIKLQEVANNKLKRKLSEVGRALEDEYEIVFELITTSSLTDNANQDLATFQQRLAEFSDNDDFTSSIFLIDNEELKRRYEFTIEKDNPSLNHTLDLSDCKYLNAEIANTKVIIASIPLKEAIQLPGIKDGTLFQKNVRQSLGLSNSVNKGIKNTIYSDKNRDFFFFHNGITAICNKLVLENGSLKLYGLQVVNGCQSLNTILSCSEKVKTLNDSYILFRFYEIPQRERADRISINTNSQSAVKPRDLRSNDKRVLNIKRLYEQKFPNGYFKTKRGEVVPAEKDKEYSIDLSDLGKWLIAWHSQRPNISYGETKIFDKYFEILFKRDYKPENVQSLNRWMNEIIKCWDGKNPLSLNPTLLAMRAYAPYHHLYAVSMCFSINNNQPDRVPNPSCCWVQATNSRMVNEIIRIAGTSLNMALEAAANEPQPQNRVFSPQNWIKAKTCLAGINFAVRNYFSMLPMMPGGAELSNRLKETLSLSNEDFEYRWAAD